MKAPSLREQNNKLRKEFQTAHLELCRERINRGITHSVLKAKNTAIKRLTNEVADLTVRLADAKAIAKGADRLCSVLIAALEKYQEKPATFLGLTREQ